MRWASKSLLARLVALILAVAVVLPAAAAGTIAHPSLWHITGPAGQVWLFGAVHVLPPDINWHTPEVKSAIAQADIFVFEVPQNAATQARIHQLIAQNGYLPEGVLLRDLLHPAAQSRYDAALVKAGLSADVVNHERPWLAGLQILFAGMGRHHLGPAQGVDSVLMAEARKAGKPTRYLETIDEQFALLAPNDPALELEEFESGLTEDDDMGAVIGPMLKAWEQGDQKALARIVDEDMAAFPKARKALFDDRNARWVPRIEAMLKEKRRFFITVGAGHLAGPKGVPALLRKAGYRVEGP